MNFNMAWQGGTRLIWRPKRCRREAPTRDVIRPDGDPVAGRFYAAIPRQLTPAVLEVVHRLWVRGGTITRFPHPYEARIRCPWCLHGRVAVLEHGNDGAVVIVGCRCDLSRLRNILADIPTVIVRATISNVDDPQARKVQ